MILNSFQFGISGRGWVNSIATSTTLWINVLWVYVITPGVVLLKGSCCSHLFHPVTVVARFQKSENWTTLWVGIIGTYLLTHMNVKFIWVCVCDLRLWVLLFKPLLMIGMQSFFMPHHHRVIGQSLFFLSGCHWQTTVTDWEPMTQQPFVEKSAWRSVRYHHLGL